MTKYQKGTLEKFPLSILQKTINPKKVFYLSIDLFCAGLIAVGQLRRPIRRNDDRGTRKNIRFIDLVLVQ